MTRLNFFRARLLAESPSGAVTLAYCSAAVAVPTLIRTAIDNVVSDTTFGTYYPFVLLSALIVGWRNAGLVAIASGFVANFLFMQPRYSFMASPTDTFGAILFLGSAAMIIVVAQTLRRTVQELESVRRREGHLNLELQHRVKNTLAVVQALAGQTFRETPEAKEGLTKFQGRIRALAQANDILSSGRWEACGFPELAVRALEPFNYEGAISLQGPPASLPEASCVPLVLALHELATNAVKYGALSTPDGMIDLGWSITEQDGGCAHLILHWIERGGPPVSEPTRRGLGARLLRGQPGLSEVVSDFRPEGLECRITVSGVRPRSSDGTGEPLGVQAWEAPTFA